MLPWPSDCSFRPFSRAQMAMTPFLVVASLGCDCYKGSIVSLDTGTRRLLRPSRPRLLPRPRFKPHRPSQSLITCLGRGKGTIWLALEHRSVVGPSQTDTLSREPLNGSALRCTRPNSRSRSEHSRASTPSSISRPCPLAHVSLKHSDAHSTAAFRNCEPI